MKKILMFLCCVFAMNVNVAFAECRLVMGSENNNNALNVDGGLYYCGGDGCYDGDIVGVAGTAKIGKKIQSAGQLYRCNAKDARLHDDKWEVVGPVQDCSVALLKNDSNAHRVFKRNRASAVGKSEACWTYECNNGYSERDDGSFHGCFENDKVCDRPGDEETSNSCKWLKDSFANGCKRTCTVKRLWNEVITDCKGMKEPSADGKSCVGKDYSKTCSAIFNGQLIEGSVDDWRQISCDTLGIYENNSMDGYESSGYGWEYAKTCMIRCQANGNWIGTVQTCDETVAELAPGGKACKKKELSEQGSSASGVTVNISNNSSNVNDNNNTNVNGRGNVVGNSGDGNVTNTGNRSNVGNSGSSGNNTGNGSVNTGTFVNGSSESGEENADDSEETVSEEEVVENKPQKTQKQIDCESTGGVWHGVGDEGFGPEFCDCKGKKLIKDRCVVVDNGGGQTQPGGQSSGNDGGATPGGAGNQNPSTPVEQRQETLYECPSVLVGNWRVMYAGCHDVIAAFEELEIYCQSAGRAENGYMTRYTRLQQLRRACEEKKQQQRITNSTAIINETSKKLDDIMAGLKGSANVWKTAEGNFNGARLASDSIAGVVLGTAGGLITSHLVKKGQVKNGFEDVQCTVGGQKVADWGDEFTVGIR